jgi:predicted regulator of Ras-like GTPase activity (Roadblock/LC7/MglB family)
MFNKRYLFYLKEDQIVKEELIDDKDKIQEVFLEEKVNDPLGKTHEFVLEVTTQQETFQKPLDNQITEKEETPCFELEPKMTKTIKDALNDFLRIEGVSTVAIVGRDGFVIESVSKVKLDSDGLGAVVASAIGASEMVGKEFHIGKLEQYLLEFETGKTIIAAIGDDILVLTMDLSAIIGSVRYAVKKGADGITKLMAASSVQS